jgi:7-cyano-7-deazaguanine synthase
MSILDGKSALVLFSGGQDSATCLALALSRFDRVETVGFNYGQRHSVELEVREPLRRGLAALSQEWAGRLGADHMIPLEILGSISASSLTSPVPFGTRQDGLPSTFVPGRNLVFLTFACILSYQREIKHVIGGMCETDYSGYPDCRDDTIKALQATVNLGMNARVVIETPLMWIDKAATWALAEQLGGPPLVDLIVEKSHTCYLGDHTHRHPWGYGCGECDACKLRSHGWHRYRGMIDTLQPNEAANG